MSGLKVKTGGGLGWEWVMRRESGRGGGGEGMEGMNDGVMFKTYFSIWTHKRKKQANVCKPAKKI